MFQVEGTEATLSTEAWVRLEVSGVFKVTMLAMARRGRTIIGCLSGLVKKNEPVFLTLLVVLVSPEI